MLEIPLLMLLIHSGVWALLSPGDRKRVKRVRWWLCVAIDAASRCILGMRMGPTASPQLALATLKMIFENKDKYTKAAGAESTWNSGLRNRDAGRRPGLRICLRQVRPRTRKPRRDFGESARRSRRNARPD